MKKAKSRLWKWMRRTLFLLAAMVFLLVAAKWWIVPAVVRAEAQSGLRPYFDGKVTFEDIDFNFTGPTTLRGISLRDALGREWLHVDSVKLSLANWPGTHPVLTEVEIGQVLLATQGTEGGPSPIRRAPPRARQAEGSPYVDLRKVTIGRISVASDGRAWGKFRLSAERQAADYQILLTELSVGEGEHLSLSGRVNAETSGADLALRLSHKAEKSDVAVALAAAGLPPALQAEGRVDASLTICGQLSDWEGLNLRGDASLKEGKIWWGRETIASDIAGKAAFGGQRIDLNPLTANTCEGKAAVVLRADLRPGGRTRYALRSLVTDVNLVRLIHLVAPQEPIRQGTLIASCAVAAEGGDLSTLNGRGMIVVRQADVWGLPVLPDVLSILGEQAQQLTLSDAEAAFTLRGPVVTIQQAKLANPLTALVAQSGGTVDLRARRLDVYVVAVPVHQAREFLDLLPGMSLLTRFQDKLTRLHVMGPWEEPQVTKESLKDVAEGTLQFLLDAVSAGGKLGADVTAGVEKLFQQGNGEKPQ